MEYSICTIGESEDIKKQAANILFETFAKNPDEWPKDEQAALGIVHECIAAPNVCIGIQSITNLIGWTGLRPMYEKTWELHPMVIKTAYQRKGYGKILLKTLEEMAQAIDIIGIVVGSDDENNSTSISEKEITGDNIFEEIKSIQNYKNHPYTFYKKCGYAIVGIIPNANGSKKPDIWLWKDIRKKR